MATDLLNAGMGDVGRLKFIQECITKQKPLYNTDKKYLRQKYQEFETKLEILSGRKKKKAKVLVSDDTLDKIVDEAISKENEDKDVIPKRRKKSFLQKLLKR